MYTVPNYETGEIQCQCAAYSKALDIAQAPRQMKGEHMTVLRGDEVMFDTRNGCTEA